MNLLKIFTPYILLEGVMSGVIKKYYSTLRYNGYSKVNNNDLIKISQSNPSNYNNDELDVYKEFLDKAVMQFAQINMKNSSISIAVRNKNSDQIIDKIKNVLNSKISDDDFKERLENTLFELKNSDSESYKNFVSEWFKNIKQCVSNDKFKNYSALVNKSLEDIYRNFSNMCVNYEKVNLNLLSSVIRKSVLSIRELIKHYNNAAKNKIYELEKLKNCPIGNLRSVTQESSKNIYFSIIIIQNWIASKVRDLQNMEQKTKSLERFNECNDGSALPEMRGIIKDSQHEVQNIYNFNVCNIKCVKDDHDIAIVN